jgi:hypothetical protein
MLWDFGPYVIFTNLCVIIVAIALVLREAMPCGIIIMTVYYLTFSRHS